MNRILLSSASALAFFAAAPAFAQVNNTSTVGQTGTNGQVAVSQAGGGATSTVTQGGNNNLARVEQRGTGAVSTVEQDNGTGSSDDNNQAFVTQNGASTSFVRQTNDFANADVDQTGNGNDSDVRQTVILTMPRWNSSTATTPRKFFNRVI